MGRASRRKRQQRGLGALDSPSDLPASILTGTTLRKGDRRSKVSEALTDLVQPFVEEDLCIEGFRGLVGIGAVAWNLSLLEDPKLDHVAELLEDQDDDYRAWFQAFVSELVARKIKLFPKDDRFIAGWEVSLRPDGSYFVTAAGIGIE